MVSVGQGGDTGAGGIYPMLFGLFTPDDRLDRKAMRRQVEAIVRARAHGVAVLGLATEAHKMSTAERRTLIDWVAEDLNERLPLSVTVGETSVSGQIELARAAVEARASWIVLQPPQAKGVAESALIRFYGVIADALPIPVGLQIAPEYLGSSVSSRGLIALQAQHPNVRILNVEFTALEVARLIEETEGRFDVFNGRAGLEMPDSVRAGCVGFIPGAESTDELVRIYEGLTSGSPEEAARAEEAYRRLAPLLTFLMASIDQFLVYGKRLAVRRFGLDPASAVVRLPTAGSTPFGESIADHWAQPLGLLWEAP